MGLENKRAAPVDWPEIDPATVAPLKDGRPNMYTHMPTRMVSLAEAKARGWKYFYLGDVCIHGHKAPRFVSNPRMCVDCDRIRDGVRPIGGKGPVASSQGLSTPKLKSKSQNNDRPLEPSKLEKDFLDAYATTKDFDEAAKKINQSPAIIESRLAWSAVFRAAYDELESRIGVRHVVPFDLDFEWDEDKRSMLIRVFVDTGEIATARDAIRVSPFEFHAELQRNPQFAAKIEEVTPLAYKILEERATQDALRGNDKLLTKLLTARVPGFNESLKVDMNMQGQPTREQLVADIVRVIGLARQRHAGRDLISADPAGAIEAPPVDHADVPTGESEPYSDLL